MSHNVGTPRLEFNLFINEYQRQFLLHFRIIIGKNNSCLHLDSEVIPLTIYANFAATLVLKNVSITNNIVAGLTAYRTALVVNGTSIFQNNIGTDGD